MSSGIYVALSGAVAQEHALDTTANNLANAALPGYQRTRAVFAEVLRGQAAAGPGAAGARTRFTEVQRTVLDTTPGAVATTNRGLDAVLPEGNYLAVSTPRGERYVRGAHLELDVEGQLVAGRSPVLSDGGKPITASRDGGPVTLTEDGDVMQDGAPLARLRLVSFQDPRLLGREGASLLAATAESGPATAASTVRLQVGALEQSNTETVSAMSELVTANRSFEAFQRALDAFREADRRLVSTVPGA